MKNKKRVIGIVAAGVVLVAAAAGFVFLRGEIGNKPAEGENLVYVDSVATLAGLGSGTGMINRFGGVVEPQETVDIELASDRSVKEVYVKEGEDVRKGQDLFIYDTTEAEEELASKEIEVDRIKMDIETYRANVESLKKEKASASADEQLDYTVRIQSAENNAKRSEYELKSTQQEIEQLKKQISEAVVTSEIDGVVKTINQTNESSDMYYDDMGEGQNFMTILSTGQYRIKGTINEQNTGSLTEGDQILVHSRVDSEKVWTGTLEKIDYDNPEKNNNDMYYSSDSGDDVNTSSNYPFYVELESDEGLMLGQHVYLERDEGQLEEREGLWLPGYYIVQDDGDPYAWAADKHDRLEKRMVTLGEYDEELDEYQILEGLVEDDYIAYPDESAQEGSPVTRNIEDLYGSDSDVEDLDDMEYDMDMEGIEDVDGYIGVDEEDGSFDEELMEDEFMDEETEDFVEPMDMPDGAQEVGDAPASAE